MRSANSIKNVSYSIVGHIIATIVSFIARIFFLRYLGSVYLGLNGLFTNILTVLALAEMGFATSITFSLYKPIYDNDYSKINQLLNYFKKAYYVVMIIVITLGLITVPFLHLLIKEVPNIDESIRVIFLLFLTNTVISYFLSYKRSIIIAYQKKYVITIFRYSLFIVMNIIQILVLYYLKSFYLFLIIQIFTTLTENVLISITANKMYPFIKEKVDKLPKKEAQSVLKNVKAMFLHRIGAVTVNAITSILISIYIGIVEVGIYSNYLMILLALTTIINMVFQSITASVGNLSLEKNKDYVHKVFRSILFLNYWIMITTTLIFYVLANPFIRIWLGEEMLFSMTIVLVIVLKYYIDGIRKSVLTFRDAMGLFWYDRYKAIFEALLGGGMALLFVGYFGLIGILIGVILGTLCATTFIEPFIVYKYGFEKKVSVFFYYYFKNNFIFVFSLVIINLVIVYIDISELYQVIVNLILAVLLPSILLILFYRKTDEIEYVKNIFTQILNYIKSKLRGAK